MQLSSHKYPLLFKNKNFSFIELGLGHTHNLKFNTLYGVHKIRTQWLLCVIWEGSLQLLLMCLGWEKIG